MTVSHTVVTRFCSECRQSYPYKEVHICPVTETVPVPLVGKEEDELLGTVLGERYRIESFLERGGMGTVYLARHIVLDKPVAIKVLNEAKDEVAQKRFLLEAKAACHVNHEHIVNITDYGVLADARPYLVMEFLQGQALDALIAKGPLTPLRVCRIGEQIALGLQAVHDKGILHRDLKPGNVYLLERHRKDYVKILDFGIAKVVHDGQTPGGPAGADGTGGLPYRPTQEGMVLGTAEYLAPEQALGEPLDHRVDQYALGCILYEMLTGEVPWKGSTSMATVVKRLNEDPQPPRLRRPELLIPPPLEALTLRALSRERDKRFASMNDLALALSQALESLGGSMGDSSANISASAIGSLLDTQPRAGLAKGPSASTLRTPLNRLMLHSLTRPWLLPRPWRIGFAFGVALLIIGLVVVGLHFIGEPGNGVTRRPPGGAQPLATALEHPLPQEKSAPDETPHQTVEPSSETKPLATEGEDATRLVFENASPVEVTVSCTHQRPCTMAAQKLCQFRIGGEPGRCDVTAPGHKPQAYTFRDLRSKAHGGRVRERVLLDAKGLGQFKL